MKKYIALLFLIVFSFGFSQNETQTEKAFVRGVCTMCKERIEKVIQEIPSVEGNWNIDTKELDVTFNPKKTSLDKILRKVAEAGHDNELYLAEDDVYQQLPECCYYEREGDMQSYLKNASSHYDKDHHGDHVHLDGNEHETATEEVEIDKSSLKTTETAIVRGNCDMCKDRIESTVNADPNVKGVWDVDSKVLTMTFNPELTSKEKILQRVASVGHDNELYKAEDEIYESMAMCCLYDREGSTQDYLNKHASSNSETPENHNHEEMDEMEGTNDEHAIQLDAINAQGNQAATALDSDGVGLTININKNELLKAACCNLSESFETNATVDVAYSNAVTGTKQLKMLGLDQKYTLMSKELLPEIRGLATAYGLNFIPGLWIQGIQLTKGGSTVVNGYESISGQINTELFKTHDKPESKLNFYANTNTRFEGNLVHTDTINTHWAQSVLLHGNAIVERQDRNDDGFMDQPVGRQINLTYLLNYNDLEKSGIGTHFGVNFLDDHRLAGEMDFIEDEDRMTTNNYGVGIDISRLQLWNKTGYVFKGKPYQSIGFMNQFTYHEQESYFGLREYNGNQKTFYSNLIFESILGSTNHKYKTGLSFLYDYFDEDYLNMNFKRKETVPGAFFEYTYIGDKLTAVLGSRVDFHNLAGTQFTPRLNLKYDFTPKTIVRLSAGRGFRTANIFAESQAYFPSNREIQILDSDGEIYGLNPEIAWNYGISLQQDFRIFGNKSQIIADFFRTDFQNQILPDLDASPQTIVFHNMEENSFANSFQIQWDFEPVKRLEMRLAYKYYDTQADYTNGPKEIPFTAKQRGFLNMGYSTFKKANGQQWMIDTTLQWVGEQRIPDTSTNPAEFQLDDFADPYFLMNAQLSRFFNKNIRLYLGVENLLSYTQDDPIIDVTNPFGNYFDGGMVYAPIMPANVYLGLDIDF